MDGSRTEWKLILNNTEYDTKAIKRKRKELFDEMERRLNESSTPEDDLFYHHSSEDRIALSHAIFWVMTKGFPGSVSKEKFFLLLRQYQDVFLAFKSQLKIRLK